MEASALHAPKRFGRLSTAGPLLRLRSDEQLVTLLREGNHDAFSVIHDRYQARLFAYVRQMLSAASRQDAEDVLQDVFARAYTALRSSERAINLRPWLYRIAHNRCIDHLRSPGPVTTELFETAGEAIEEPFDHLRRREDLRQLVRDVAGLPTQQRSALLLREINGLSYRELAEALDVTVPAVKSLLVRARVELVETVEARGLACADVRADLLEACDARGRTPAHTRRHVRQCDTCREYAESLRGLRRSFAALSPIAAAGPLAVLANALGIGGFGNGATAAGGIGALGSGATGAGGVGASVSAAATAATAGKVAVVVSTVAITAGGAAQIDKRIEAGPASSDSSYMVRGDSAGAQAVTRSLFGLVPTAAPVTAAGGVPSAKRSQGQAVAPGGLGRAGAGTSTYRPAAPGAETGSSSVPATAVPVSTLVPNPFVVLPSAGAPLAGGAPTAGGPGVSAPAGGPVPAVVPIAPDSGDARGDGQVPVATAPGQVLPRPVPTPANTVPAAAPKDGTAAPVRTPDADRRPRSGGDRRPDRGEGTAAPGRSGTMSPRADGNAGNRGGAGRGAEGDRPGDGKGRAGGSGATGDSPATAAPPARGNDGANGNDLGARGGRGVGVGNGNRGAAQDGRAKRPKRPRKRVEAVSPVAVAAPVPSATSTGAAAVDAELLEVGTEGQ